MAKKNNQPQHIGKKVVAQLERPDPIAPPKSKREQKRESQQQKASLPVQAPSTTQAEPQRTNHSMEGSKSATLPHLSASRKITSSKHPFGAALAKEIEKQQEGDITNDTAPVKLLAQFGTILMRYNAEDLRKLTHYAHGPSDLQASFRKHSDLLKTDFPNRLTTSTSDAQSLLQLVCSNTASELYTDTRYEIFVRDTAGALLKVTVDANHKSAYRIRKSDQIGGEALVHFPVHVWDARFVLVEVGLESDTSSSQAIKDFIISMQTDQEAPSFRANIPLGIRIEAVLAKRSFSHDEDGMRFSVTQVQSLAQESLEDRRHNFRALVRTEEDMIAEQRLWWEAGWETFELDKADHLQAKVNEMIPRMDSIGLENKGPFVRMQGYEEFPEPEVPEVPFW